jgi:beta-phosphoglucomutase-like phosphatase (HAD superfamily)
VALDAQQIAARRKQRKHELTELQPLMPGVASYLDDAARMGMRVGLASSASRAWVERHLDR